MFNFDEEPIQILFATIQVKEDSAGEPANLVWENFNRIESNCYKHDDPHLKWIGT